MWASLLLTVAVLPVLLQGACPEYEKNYNEELGCRPEATDNSGCPTSYDCSVLSQRTAGKCHFQGKAYDVGHRLGRVPGTECLADCRCFAGNGNDGPTFTCANVECAELFLRPPPAGCYRTYDHENCCHLNEVCGESAGKAMCEYKGESLHEGQKFYPDEQPCMQCICRKGYNGSFVEPFCRKVHCNVELTNANYIASKCAPVFYGEDGCCPIDWRCPSDSDAVISSGTADEKSPPYSGKTCKFGKLSLRVGEKLNQSSERGEGTDCVCRTPPNIVCVQKESA